MLPSPPRTAEGRRRTGPARRIVVVLVSAVLAIAAVVMLPDQIHALGRRHDRAENLELVGGIPRLKGLTPQAPEFLRQVQALVPARERVRLLVTANGVGPARCSPAPAQFYFLAYQLLPRPILCDASPRWWVLYLVPDVAPPPGARVVLDVAPGLRLVDTRPAG